jgi:hypothetical protein
MNGDLACVHINLLKAVLLRGENFRWADLVSDDLKEERYYYLTSTLSLKLITVK